MAEKLKSGEVEARQVLFDEDDEVDSPEKERAPRAGVPEIRGAAEAPGRRSHQGRRRIEAGSAKDVAKRDKKVAGFQEKIKSGLVALELGERHIAAIVDKLKEATDLIRSHDRTVRDFESRSQKDRRRYDAHQRAPEGRRQERRRASASQSFKMPARRSNASPR